jgi:hypothetical protein
MMFAGSAIANSALASLSPLSTATVDAFASQPIRVMLDGVVSTAVLVNSLSIDNVIGDSATCEFTLVNEATIPSVGSSVRITYNDEVLFVGILTGLRHSINNTATAQYIECTCQDASHILARHKIQRNFSNIDLLYLIDSLIDNELTGCGFQIGTIEQYASLPLVDSRGGSAYDVLRDAGAAVGQLLSIGHDRSISYVATSSGTAPKDLTDATVETASYTEDLDDYRNVQHVKVTGTPIMEGDDPVILLHVEESTEQIAERAAIDGTDGRYEDYAEIIHPTSNDVAVLQLLASSYGQAKLTTAGTPRMLLQCRVRGYGFRAGQVASMQIALLGIAGEWILHRVNTRDEDGRGLIYDLELMPSSLRRRAYDSWLDIVDSGKISVQLPGTTGLSTATFTSTGSHQWISPIAGVVTIVTMGGSGGGGASLSGGDLAGKRGGNSGKTTSSVTVAIGDTLDIVVGAKGVGTTGTGTAGTASTVDRGGVNLSTANGGGGGGTFFGSVGTPGGGSNGAVVVGGGKTGGAGAPATHTGNQNGSPGQDGSVSIQY